LSLSSKYISSYSFILILSNQLKEMKKEKKDVIDIRVAVRSGQAQILGPDPTHWAQL